MLSLTLCGIYRISGEKSDNFAIDNDGLITTAQKLSGGDTYYLDVEARDGGSPSLKSISVVTVNVGKKVNTTGPSYLA